MLNLDISSLKNKILNGNQELKSANNAKNIIIKNASKKDCDIFVAHLNHKEYIVRNLSRQIIVAKKIEEALPDLEKKFISISKNLKFIKKNEKDELKFFQEITDIGNTIFSLAPKENYQNEKIRNIVEKLNNNSLNNQLKAVAIKLSCLFDSNLFRIYFKKYQDLSELEQKSLCETFLKIDNKEKWELYKVALKDKKKQEFIINSLIKNNDGINFFKNEIPNIPNDALFIILNLIIKNKTEETDLSIMIPSLKNLLESEQKIVVELSTKALITIYKDSFPQQKYENILKTTNNLALINSSSLLLINFSKNNENLKLKFLESVKEQEKIENKIIILNHLSNIIKENKEINIKTDEKILNYFLHFWETDYSKELNTIYIVISKSIPHLKIGDSSLLKRCKSKMLSFISKNESSIEKMIVNNIHESITNFSLSISKLEEEEKKIKEIKFLFTIPNKKINETRLDNLKSQLENITFMDNELQLTLSSFLKNFFEFSVNNWQIRAKIGKIFKEYNVKEDYNFLISKLKKEESLGVQLSIKDAVKEIKNKYVIEEKLILVIEPLFYINKLIYEFLDKKGETFISIKSFNELKEELKIKKYKLIFINDSLINKSSLNILKNIEYDNSVIISSNIKEVENKIIKNNKSNLILIKPFNEEKIEETIKEYL